jgi:hypothetical protein
MINRIRIIILAALFAGIFAAPASAASSKPEITVTPFLQNVQIGSEPSKSFDIVYANDSNNVRQLSLSVVDFGSLDQTGGVAFVGPSLLLNKYNLSPWLQLSVDTLNIAPRQTASVTAVVTNDNAMGPGGHYAAVVATVVNGNGSNANQVSLKQKISSLVFVTKTGGEKYDLSLQQVGSNSGLFRLPTEAYLTIKATGNTHIVPRGIVYLKDKSGKVLSKGEINQESGFVLPGTSRVFTVKLNKLASARPWSTSYKLQVDYRYDGIDQFASKNFTIHSFNPAMFVIFLILLAAAVWVVYKFAINPRQNTTKS